MRNNRTPLSGNHERPNVIRSLTAAVSSLILLAALASNAPGQRFGGEPTQKAKTEKKAEPKKDEPRADPAPTSDAKPKSDGLIASAGGLLCFIVYALLVFLLGLAPTWIAIARKHPNTIPIFLVNLFLGWFCGIGWVWALVWSFTNPHPPGSTIIIEDRGRRRSRRRDDDYDDD